ncbi:SRPBCC domain-containing protein [Pontibacter sp. G13]|uniref:SRPBCC domain-containing protein n=1 Tax=Pontibacter sp. G13 TaxID=3074898 RepID=UPI00288AD710|nr:SRPBCC domain-containing protein [Pontibacter sp. G13]WNJ17063.1 SRPBCC domain-containing protein [Pontibacter sp. G13]
MHTNSTASAKSITKSIESRATYQLHTEIIIEAAPEQVWAVLMDFAAYPAWNPFIRTLEGQQEVGSTLQAEIHPPEGSPMTFKPELLVLDEHREFRWLGKLFVSGLFDGEHVFQLERLANGHTRFVQAEYFKGILVPLMRKMLDVQTRAGFEAMNRALRDQVLNG